MLELDHVTAGYGGIPVLSSVSLTVPAGTVAALLGPNGAGKTTLLKVASGLHPLTGGRVRIGSRDLTGAPPDDFVTEGLCHIPEGRGIFRSLSVRDNLTLFSEPGRAKELVDRVLSQFPHLERHLNQRAGTLSGGQQQMVALSRAFSRPFGFVVIDELSMGLAPIVVDEMFTVVRRLAEEGSGLLLVEQYAEQVLKLVDLVYLLDRGKVVYAGEPAELEGEDLFMQYIGAR